jgi:hypothetical protein
MTVTVQRSGGIGGWRERLGPVETSGAPNGDEIVQAVLDADFFNLPSKYPPAQVIYDGYRYSLSVGHDGKSHAVAWEDGSDVPDGVLHILAVAEKAAEWSRL